MKQLYRFDARVVAADPTGYYYARWDKATPVSVVAATRVDAYQAIFALMGEAPRYHEWRAQIDKISDARLVES